MTLTTRKPTGKPSWPMVLLAGSEGAGKSWAAAAASASPSIARTLWIGIGEDDPDEYSTIPGTDFEIVEHDGSYAAILQAFRDVATLPYDGVPNLLVGDSMSRLWTLIGDNLQGIANQRAKGRKGPGGDFTITPDLWNVGAARWVAVMDAIRLHRGPAILTARLEQVTVMENGQPTAEKQWKIQGHKTLPYDASVIVEMPVRGQFRITKVKSARIALEAPRSFPGFTVGQLWDDLGVTSGETANRQHATTHLDATPRDPTDWQPSRDWQADAMAADSKEELRVVWTAAKNDGSPTVYLDGISLLAARFPDAPALLVADGAEPTPEEDR